MDGGDNNYWAPFFALFRFLSAAMPLDIDLASLRGQLKQARDELEQWAQNLATEARKAKHKHDAVLEGQYGEQLALEEREHALSRQVEELAQLAEEQGAEEEALAEEAQQARDAADALPTQVASLAADVAATRERLARAKAAEGVRIASVTGTLDTVAQVVDKYASELGMSFSHAPGEFTVTFHLLDAAEPERECSFTLLTDAGGPGSAYTLAACQPQLDAAPQLVAQLNAQPQSHGLQRFVAAMRGAFRAACAPAQLCAA